MDFLAPVKARQPDGPSSRLEQFSDWLSHGRDDVGHGVELLSGTLIAALFGMRKHVISASTQSPSSTEPWLDLDRLARVEVTSEDSQHPIELALLPNGASGWLAAEPGPQTVRILFDQPQSIRLIHLEFDESEQERLQEFVLRWLPEHDGFYRDIVRQQYTFSPSGATREIEDYHVNLTRCVALELSIVPELSGRPLRASLAKLRLA